MTVPTEPPLLPDVSEIQQHAIHIGFLIHDVSRKRRLAFTELMRPVGVTQSQWWILAHLARRDGMMQTQLASMLNTGDASLGTTLSILERDGMIKRPVDAVDRRARRIFLSDRARVLISKMQCIEIEFNEALLENLSASDVRGALSSLTKIRGRLVREGAAILPIGERSAARASRQRSAARQQAPTSSTECANLSAAVINMPDHPTRGGDGPRPKAKGSS